jgi:hypothetical protein
MTSKEALRDISFYLAFKDNVLYEQKIVIDRDIEKLDKLKNEIQTKIDTLQKRQEYLNNCLGSMEFYIEYNFNMKKLELLLELKEVFENE